MKNKKNTNKQQIQVTAPEARNKKVASLDHDSVDQYIPNSEEYKNRS